MQQSIILNAQLRDTATKKAPALRRAGAIPAVLYGHNVPSRVLQVNAREFEKVYKQAGASTLVDLKIGEGEPVKVLVQEVQPHYITLKPIHVDFYQVSMTEKLTAKIPLKFMGESPAVKELGAVLVKNMQEVEVECLPQDLVHEIEVDLSGLKAFGDAVHIKDVALPPGIAVKAKADATVVLVQEPRKEEEAVTPPTEKEAIEKITTVADEKKAKKEEEEKAEKAATESTPAPKHK